LLKEIAVKTGGQYFRATTNTKLEEIYGEINKLEKTDIEEFKYTNYNEMFRPWAIFALVLIAFEFLLRNTIFKGFL
jgi:Ca-activated chloride channel family protein